MSRNFQGTMWLGTLITALCLVTMVPSRADAQVTQIKPRIMIFIDSSGSMAWDVSADYTYGDGSNDPWGSGNCCKGNGGSRMYIAKEAMSQMLNATGDIDFGLMKFNQSYYNHTEFSSSTNYNSGQYDGNQGSGADELPTAGGSGTFDTDSNQNGREDWLCVEYRENNTQEIMMWMNHHEFSAAWTIDTAPAGISLAPGHDGYEREIRADGGTPIHSAADAARWYITTYRNATIADAASTYGDGSAEHEAEKCRPYAMIMLTDGEADNNTLARTAVQNLYNSIDGVSNPMNRKVDVWVIGLAYQSTNLDALAARGGSHLDPETGRAYYADSQATLSSILYQIVSASVMTETCEYTDEDCDGDIDEGLRNSCNTCDDLGLDYCGNWDTQNPRSPYDVTHNTNDDDCDGTIDEDADYLVETGAGDDSCSHAPGGQPADQGVCQPGVYQCQGGEWICTGGVGPTSPDICDGLDNDCDGITDEDANYITEGHGATTDCSDLPPEQQGVGGCNWGSQLCSDGAWVCDGYGLPESEGLICDGIDNDCDNDADEGISQVCGGGPVNGGDSICREGIQYCDPLIPGNWDECTGSVTPGTETCNGWDDDCDGTVDDAPQDSWMGSTCGGPNAGTCVPGEWMCVTGGKQCCANGIASPCNAPVYPQSEYDAVPQCNNLDDDCDGETDENIRQQCWDGIDGGTPSPGNAGQCVLGWRECLNGAVGWGSCDGYVGPSAETCDNVDNDCNNTVDDGIDTDTCGGAPEGDPNTGTCHTGILSCVGGQFQCNGDQGPVAETCDDSDNDCDGDVDESLFQSCWEIADPAVPVGICRAGIQTCSAGSWGSCEGAIIPQESELCNGEDDDCDGNTDEGPYSTDDVVGKECDQCGGVWVCDTDSGEPECDGVSATPEVCDGLDNDCNGLTDENTRVCGGCLDTDDNIYNPDCDAGVDAGICAQGVQYCDDAADTGTGYELFDTECVGSIEPMAEICDGYDNDCDGDVDNNIGQEGNPCGPAAIGECDAGQLSCVVDTDDTDAKTMECCAEVDTDSNCIPPQGPTVEECDGEDDNCNGIADDGLTNLCGGCDTDMYPGFDCPNGPNEGPCQQGQSSCNAVNTGTPNTWTQCLGDVGPDLETCNMVDDDCNGVVDDGVVFNPSECNRSNTSDMYEGICEPGAWVCTNGNPDCQGGVGPALEDCNGLDDDCDGTIDDDVPHAGEECGIDVGECEPGNLVCVCDDVDTADCGLDCVGGLSGSEEDCNCKDDDCDGQTDEGIPLGVTCYYGADGNVYSPADGEPEGECTLGNWECVNCGFECNANQPSAESCDGKDNDCDGETDENLAVECPTDTICVEGECASECEGTENSCPPGKTCEELNGKMVCVTDVCSPSDEDALECVSNPYFCSDGHEPPCFCSAVEAECINPCEKKVCPEGKNCFASVVNGEAVAGCQSIGEDCYTTDCPTGEKCVGGDCVADPCADKECLETEYCNNSGECVSPCDATNDCPDGCFEGECVDDKCAGVHCEQLGYSCDPQTGECVGQGGPCWGVNCKTYEVCDANGDCIEDPCFNIDCPNGMVCIGGGCYPYGDEPDSDSDGPDTDPEEDTEPGGEDTEPGGEDTEPGGEGGGGPTGNTTGDMNRIEATGAGGCLCSSTPARSNGNAGIIFVAMGLILVAFRFGRKRLRALLPVSIMMMAMLVLGCQTDPYVFAPSTDTDPLSTDPSTGSGIGEGEGEGEGDDPFTDPGTGTGECGTDTIDDDCDGFDDDCDGSVDEDVDLENSVSHCGECNNECEFQHAYPTCEGGECKMGDCAVFFYDLNASDTDGCEYNCEPTVDEADSGDMCDGVDLGDTDNPYIGKDNDCDGDFDEDADLDNRENDCGRCGNICRYANAGANCVSGECVMEACEDGYWDLNASDTDGCEYHCEIAGTGEERCNGADDDCDGEIDEAANPASPYGAGGGDPCVELNPGCTDVDSCEGICAAGILKCEAGDLRCKDQIMPENAESCDNLDNDCDGATDEEGDIALVGNDDGTICGSGIGQCTQGQRRCARETAGVTDRSVLCCESVDGDGVCVAPAPPEAVEVTCNGLDDDCDGEIDENIVGTNQCSYGQTWIAGDSEPSLVSASGRCATYGSWECSWGSWTCNGALSPIVETCNNVDDNCNGIVDESLYQGCHTGTYDEVGTCRYGLSQCASGSWGACQNELEPTDEFCDGRDNDCNGIDDDNIDTDDPQQLVGKVCGFGVCAGTYICSGGSISCDGGQASPFELPCNGIDDNCNGNVDERDSWLCGGCDGNDTDNPDCVDSDSEDAPDQGNCRQGTWSCNGTTPECLGTIEPEPETCNNVDDDCDGVTDEDADGNVLEGGSCGSAKCGMNGTNRCRGGFMVCEDATYPSQELCDTDSNNDCDTETPNGAGESWYGQACDGSDGDLCAEGILECVETSPGVWGQQCSETGSGNVEECNGLDDDCDSETDEGLTPPAGLCPANDGICGTGHVEKCTAVGWVCDYDCANGVIECDTDGRPVPEEILCDSKNGDCDTDGADDIFDLQFDVNNCGGCNNDCETDGAWWTSGTKPTNATVGCQNGTCIILGCTGGMVDDSTIPGDDCLYSCSLSNGGEEICDGLDNDCDKDTDENAVSEICNGIDDDCDSDVDNADYSATGNCKTVGVCAGQYPALATCESSGWNCNYSSIPDYNETETCDGLDNNCDGNIDEIFGRLATDCWVAKGEGQCEAKGTWMCASGGSDVCCDADNDSDGICDVVLVANDSDYEECDNIDNDCDGIIDEGIGDTPSHVGVDYMSLTVDGVAYDVFMHEASKADADMYVGDSDTDHAMGFADVNAAACSQDDRVPWTMVDFDDAQAACQLLNEPGKNCGSSPCWDVCPRVLWEHACSSASGGEQNYPYSNTYGASTCNGKDYNSSWDHVIGSGNATNCVADWGTDDLSDLSGNVEEWTSQTRTIGSTSLYEIRGGSFNDEEGGLTCGFDFWAAEADLEMPNLGFRCCRYQHGNCNLGIAALDADFSSGNGDVCATDGWTLESAWGVGKFNNECVLATVPDGLYSDGLDLITATSPTIDLSGCGGTVTLNFRMTRNVEEQSSCGYDWGDLQVWNGSSWARLDTSPGYDANNRWCDDDAGSWPGSPSWANYSVDVSSYKNSDFAIRFRFDSDSSTRKYGIYIDDVYLSN